MLEALMKSILALLQSVFFNFGTLALYLCTKVHRVLEFLLLASILSYQFNIA